MHKLALLPSRQLLRFGRSTRTLERAKP
uniref:Uncharacterized protein n=1 Tax=Rhizophora mucronata TaxID=61149 RepID=A0A2P2NCE5_RHIMU